jgi:hypothetical protein
MMSTKIKATFASLGVAALLLPAVAGAAGEGKKFSRADFDRCNQQAMQIAGVDTDAPAALPGAAQPGTQPGTQQETQPGTQPGMQQPGTQPGAGAGTTGTGVGAGAGTTGTGVGAAVGDEDRELDRIVDAYRDCLQQAKQQN